MKQVGWYWTEEAAYAAANSDPNYYVEPMFSCGSNGFGLFLIV